MAVRYWISNASIQGADGDSGNALNWQDGLIPASGDDLVAGPGGEGNPPAPDRPITSWTNPPDPDTAPLGGGSLCGFEGQDWDLSMVKFAGDLHLAGAAGAFVVAGTTYGDGELKGGSLHDLEGDPNGNTIVSGGEVTGTATNCELRGGVIARAVGGTMGSDSTASVAAMTGGTINAGSVEAADGCEIQGGTVQDAKDCEICGGTITGTITLTGPHALGSTGADLNISGAIIECWCAATLTNGGYYALIADGAEARLMSESARFTVVDALSQSVGVVSKAAGSGPVTM